MPEPDLIELFAKPLDQAAIGYLITGSVAAMLYGEPRVTLDIDFVAFLGPDDAARLETIFKAPKFYTPPAAVILQEMARHRGGHFNIIDSDSGLKADFYPAGEDELHAWALQNARRFPIGDALVTFAAPEYVILRKLEYYRLGSSDKHLRDIRAILALTGEELNHAALEDWIERLDLKAEWRLVH